MKLSTVVRTLLLSMIVIAICLQQLTIMLNGQAIDSLVLQASKQATFEYETMVYMTSIHRELNKHIETGCIGSENEDKLLKQMDLLVATSRLGWWDEEGRAIHTSPLFTGEDDDR